MNALILAVQVGLADPSPAGAPAEPTEVSMLPTPFTADEIRAGMPVGLVIDWEAVENGSTSRPRWTVLAATATEVTLRFSEADATGELIGEAQDRTLPFEGLRRHALFAPDVARREVVQVTSPVGTGPGWRYTVLDAAAEGGATRTQHTFLTALPGAPVHTLVTRDGRTVYEQRQVARRGP